VRESEHGKIIWILADDRAGNVSQALGVAESLGLPFEVKKIVYNKQSRLANFIRGASLLGVDLANSSEISAPWPDVVIAAGRKTGPIARYIKKSSGGTSKLVQLMWPGFPSGDFDLIAAPEHDGLKENTQILNTIGAPNRVTIEMLAKEGEKWAERLTHLPAPRVALLVGGTTKNGVFTKEHAHELAEKIAQFFAGKEGSLMITNSRRTSLEVTEILRNEIKIKSYFHDFRSSNENPFFAYLALSDAIIASGDSVSMCSEACSTGKPVYIYAPENITHKKHAIFHQNLYKHRFAKPLSGMWSDWNYEPLGDSKKIADLIRKKYL
jgi:mitochondrial fission protein ELM1